MPKRTRKHAICGIMAEREGDGMWTWSIFNRAYRWDPSGHVEALEDDGGIIRHVKAESIDAAIAWTVGYATAIYHAAGFVVSREAELN